MNGFDPEQWKRNETPKSFFNPLLKSFTFDYLDDKNQSIKLEVPSRTLLTKPTYLADFIIKKLLDEVALHRYGGKYITPEEKDKILKDEILI